MEVLFGGNQEGEDQASGGRARLRGCGHVQRQEDRGDEGGAGSTVEIPEGDSWKENHLLTTSCNHLCSSADERGGNSKTWIVILSREDAKVRVQAVAPPGNNHAR